MVIDLQLHDLAQFGWFGAIDREGECLLEKCIRDRRQVLVQRHDAAAPRLVGKAQQQLDRGVAIDLSCKEDTCQTFEGSANSRQGKLQHHRAEGSAKNDHGRRGLQNLAYMSTLDQQAGKYARQSKYHSTKATFIHDEFFPMNSFQASIGVPEPFTIHSGGVVAAQRLLTTHREALPSGLPVLQP